MEKNDELFESAPGVEKSLQELKSLPSTSEAQLAADLSRRPHFVGPLITACNTGNAKFVAPAVSCLQRLATVRGLPEGRLEDIIEALRLATSLSSDVQLKILQALPSLVLNYRHEISGDLLASVLHICSVLLQNKVAAISSSATATFQQLVGSAYDKVKFQNDDSHPVTEIRIEDTSIPVGTYAFDAFRLLNDLCLLVGGQKPRFVKSVFLSQAFALELIGTLLADHGNVFQIRPEQAYLMRCRILPMIVKVFRIHISFPIGVRASKVLQIILQYHATISSSMFEQALELLNSLVNGTVSPQWKRVIAMEVLRNLFVEPGFVLALCSKCKDQHNGRPAIYGTLDLFARVASENPAATGFGLHQGIHSDQTDLGDTSEQQAAMESGGLAGLIAAPLVTSEHNVSGIGVLRSNLKTSLIDQLDKPDTPWIPHTYLHSLVLQCVNSFSENMCRDVIPLATRRERRSKRVDDTRTSRQPDIPETSLEDEVGSRLAGSGEAAPLQLRQATLINPSTLGDYPYNEIVNLVTSMIDDCWPALLATVSVFLNAGLDSDLYRGLLRSFQKLVQVAGVLRLTTARDAFLTELGKCAMPAAARTVTSPPTTPTRRSSGMFHSMKGLLSSDSLPGQISSSPIQRIGQATLDMERPALTTRNLLCLRALLNLAIALGPTLQTAWTIVFETLQQAETVWAARKLHAKRILSGGRTAAANEADSVRELDENIRTEIAAVEFAASRMLERTADYPDEAFRHVLEALFACLPRCIDSEGSTLTPSELSQGNTQSHRRGPSFFGMSSAGYHQTPDGRLTLAKLEQIAAANITRLATRPPKESGWDLVIQNLVKCASDSDTSSQVRLAAANIVKQVVVGTVESIGAAEPPPSVDEEADAEARGNAQLRPLQALQFLISSLGGTGAASYEESSATAGVAEDILRVALEALRLIIEQSGYHLGASWQPAFEILRNVFRDPDASTNKTNTLISSATNPIYSTKVLSEKLCRSAFASIELVCSDFLSHVPLASLRTLIDVLSLLCEQSMDLNISLTTITHFWNLTSFLHNVANPPLLDYLAKETVSERILLNQLQPQFSGRATSLLWLSCMCQLVHATNNSRGEVRNTTVKTVLNILDTVGDRLRCEDWETCISWVIFPMIETKLKTQHKIKSGNIENSVNVASWNETTKGVIEGAATLLASYMPVISHSSNFDQLWEELARFLESYLDLTSPDISSATYSAVTRLLMSFNTGSQVVPNAIERVTALCLSRVPVQGSARDHETLNDNDMEFVGYVNCLKEIYRLVGASMSVERVEKILDNLEYCLHNSQVPPYFKDAERLTPLQANVLDCLKLINTDSPDLCSLLVCRIAIFLSLPLRDEAADQSIGSPTFVAFSKASIDVLQPLVAGIASRDYLTMSQSLMAALSSLHRLIASKYRLRNQGKEPPLWQQATTCAVVILAVFFHESEFLRLERSCSEDLLDKVCDILDSILNVDMHSSVAGTVAIADEDFDLEAFKTLSRTVLPLLSDRPWSRPATRKYTRVLFQTSFIHDAPPPKPTDELNVISAHELLAIRPGRVYDPPAHPRRRIAYICFDELVKLVSTESLRPQFPGNIPWQDMYLDAQRVRPAKAASPYFLLRVAHPIKAYIADTPLRGRYMPFPSIQLDELLYVLRRSRDLDSIPFAFEQVKNKDDEDYDVSLNRGTKAHLVPLFPLLTKALEIAAWRKWRGDGLVLEELRLCLDVLSRVVRRAEEMKWDDVRWAGLDW